MPNCDFYATIEDHIPLLAWLFSLKVCSVYELYSDYGQEIKEFKTTEEVLDQFKKKYTNGKEWNQVCLQLYLIGAAPIIAPEKINLKPEFCDGATYRYSMGGWGAIQLYLSVPDEKGLQASHTNHNSETRARKWDPVSNGSDRIDNWDFEKITKFALKLNREIKKYCEVKVSSRPIMPNALAYWESGNSLLPYGKIGKFQPSPINGSLN